MARVMGPTGEPVRRTTGVYSATSIRDQRVSTFRPHPLPPDPPLQLRPEDRNLIEAASRELGRLDALSSMLPDVSLFLYSYVRKEALVSAQIEGTQSSFADLLVHESGDAPGVPNDDVSEVSDYVAALELGLQRLRGGMPLSSRLLREIHAVLMRSGRGRNSDAGRFRRVPVWLGGTQPQNAVFVPPSAPDIAPCIADLERFLHDEPSATPTLLKAAMAHVQFETIHPFLDGNGRLGRLLITLILCAEGALVEPILFLSLHFKQNRSAYYDGLQRVRAEGDWEGWVRFFLQGVVETARSGVDTTRRILDQFERDRQTIEVTLDRAAASALQVHRAFQHRPLRSVRDLMQVTGRTAPTVSRIIKQLVDLGMLDELTGNQRYRRYVYRPYLDILSEGTEPLPR
ncbi:MAG: Fic family protein [Acidobacteriota bacterium]